MPNLLCNENNTCLDLLHALESGRAGQRVENTDIHQTPFVSSQSETLFEVPGDDPVMFPLFQLLNIGFSVETSPTINMPRVLLDRQRCDQLTARAAGMTDALTPWRHT